MKAGRPSAERFRLEARQAGFEVVGFANLPEDWDAEAGLRAFVAAGHHGEMDWMETTLERRVHPRAMWPEAQSAIVLGMNYGPEADPLPELAKSDRAYVSVYARGEDYHELIKGRLKGLASVWAKASGAGVKVFVDTAPLMEKPLAALAGLGFQGKHTNLVSRDLGSWLFLGVILTDQVMDPSLTAAPEAHHCGSCTACLDICPTQAFVAPFRLEARACLSYLTIEHKGAWPVRYRAVMGNRVYGCDDCLAVCPWNKFAQMASEARLQPRPGMDAPLAELFQLDEAGFKARFARSPIKRIGWVRFLRNLAYGLGNYLRAHKDDEACAVLKSRLSNPDPVVRGAVVWALAQGLAEPEFARLRDRALPHESDLKVQAEWRGQAA